MLYLGLWVYIEIPFAFSCYDIDLYSEENKDLWK